MSEKPERLKVLREFLAWHGVELSSDDAGVQRLNDFFLAHVSEDPDSPGRLLPEWYSVALDMGLFLGDVMIERNPNLYWEFHTWGKKNTNYQKQVVAGFNFPDPKYSVDPEGIIVIQGNRVIDNMTVKSDKFIRAVHQVSEDANL
ncbi:hypothetical protein J2S53_001113 [Actinopolyspora lacussalsi]|nr:hypothetical protein [Actinopolyspora lacussalsi]